MKHTKETPEPLHDKLSLKLRQLPEGKLAALKNAFTLIIDFLNIESVDAAPIITANPHIPNSEQ